MSSLIRVHFPGLKSGGLDPSRSAVDLARALLVPGVPGDDSAWGRRFHSFYSQARDYFTAVPADEAQLFFYPYVYAPGEEADAAALEAKQRGVPCIFVSVGDDPAPPRMPAAGLLFRHSIFANERRPHEHAWPAVADDCLRPHGGRVVERHKGARPSVGFRGFVGSAAQRLAYRLVGRGRKADGLAFRANVLRRLSRNRKIETVFTRLNHFSLGAQGILSHDAALAEKTWSNYVSSLLATDYTLCLRGAGNFSYRFYETLAAGRIPVFVNTRCVLPFEEQIPWKQHCVWVEEADLDQIGDHIAEFHDRMSDADFVARQQANRQLWLDWLTLLGFYRKVFPLVIDGTIR
jgi:hypothetical protein